MVLRRNWYLSINDNSSIHFNAVGASTGSWVGVRSGSGAGNIAVYNNGSLRGSAGGGSTTGLTTENFYILAQNNGGPAIMGAGLRFAAASVGSLLNATSSPAVSSSGGTTGTGFVPRLCTYLPRFIRRADCIVIVRLIAGALLLLATVSVGGAFLPRHGGGLSSSSCGPDTAPPAAAAAGYTCETYRWGSGDTLGEINTTGSGAPGFKWYLGTSYNNGYNASAAEISMPSGKLLIHPSTNQNGGFLLNTCWGRGPGSGYTTGTSFTGGYYIELVEEWDATGFDPTQGKPGGYGITKEFQTNPGSNHGFEIDNPDAYAEGQSVNDWNGGVVHQFPNIGQTHGVPTVETGNKYGVLVTNTGVSWWFTDLANGTVDFSALPGDPPILFGQHLCFGLMGTSQFTITVDSLKVWQ